MPNGSRIDFMGYRVCLVLRLGEEDEPEQTRLEQSDHNCSLVAIFAVHGTV